MDLRDTLLKLLRAPDYVPLRQEEIVAVLRLSPDKAKKATKLIAQLLDSGEVVRIKRDRLVMPKDADLVSGKILFRQSGSAILIADSDAGKKAPSASRFPPKTPPPPFMATRSSHASCVAQSATSAAAVVATAVRRRNQRKNPTYGLSASRSARAKPLWAISARAAIHGMSFQTTHASFRISLYRTQPTAALNQDPRRVIRSWLKFWSGNNVT